MIFIQLLQLCGSCTDVVDLYSPDTYVSLSCFKVSDFEIRGLGEEKSNEGLSVHRAPESSHPGTMADH